MQDISCLGQCSMTVALPILSVCGLETCILPTMVLSTHTGGLGEPVRRDLTADIMPIAEHWQRQDICFDGICVGYLGKAQQARMVGDIAQRLLSDGGLLIVDPAVADHGKLYGGIDERCVEEMKQLCHRADVILPNITEACLLAGIPYHQPQSEMQVHVLLDALEQQYGGNIVLTGVELEPGQIGFALRCGGEDRIYQRARVGKAYHGIGDMFAAVFTGAAMQARDMFDAAVLAAEFTARVAAVTFADPAHGYGTKFETVLPWLVDQLQKNVEKSASM